MISDENADRVIVSAKNFPPLLKPLVSEFYATFLQHPIRRINWRPTPLCNYSVIEHYLAQICTGLKELATNSVWAIVFWILWKGRNYTSSLIWKTHWNSVLADPCIDMNWLEMLKKCVLLIQEIGLHVAKNEFDQKLTGFKMVGIAVFFSFSNIIG